MSKFLFLFIDSKKVQGLQGSLTVDIFIADLKY